MNKERAKKVLLMLDRISQEIDVLGGVILKKELKPIPVRIKGRDKLKFK